MPPKEGSAEERVGTDTGTLAGKSKQDAILSILRPEQREAYEAEREKRHTEARQEMEAIGLTLPEDWKSSDMLDF
jgi:hypothetical protein